MAACCASATTAVNPQGRGRRLSAATVLEAYLRLERDGYVHARDRSGFYVLHAFARAYPEPKPLRAVVPPAPVGISQLVTEVLHQTGDRKLVPLGVSTLGPTILPIARLNRAFRRVLATAPMHSARYTAIRGHLPLRRQIARRALASGMVGDADDIVITSGGMDARTSRCVPSPIPVMSLQSESRSSKSFRRSNRPTCASWKCLPMPGPDSIFNFSSGPFANTASRLSSA